MLFVYSYKQFFAEVRSTSVIVVV